MSGLSQEDRELIRQAINDIPLRHLGWAANAETIRDELAPTLNDLVARHVREALEEVQALALPELLIALADDRLPGPVADLAYRKAAQLRALLAP